MGFYPLEDELSFCVVWSAFPLVIPSAWRKFLLFPSQAVPALNVCDVSCGGHSINCVGICADFSELLWSPVKGLSHTNSTNKWVVISNSCVPAVPGKGAGKAVKIYSTLDIKVHWKTVEPLDSHLFSLGTLDQGFSDTPFGWICSQLEKLLLCHCPAWVFGTWSLFKHIECLKL